MRAHWHCFYSSHFHIRKRVLMDERVFYFESRCCIAYGSLWRLGALFGFTVRDFCALLMTHWETLSALIQSSQKRSLCSLWWHHSCYRRFYIWISFFVRSTLNRPILRDVCFTCLLKHCLFISASGKKWREGGGSRQSQQNITYNQRCQRWMSWRDIKYPICLWWGDGRI